MKKKQFLIGFLFIITLVPGFAQQGVGSKFSTAGFYEVPNGPRKVFNFNYGWRFIKSDVVGAEKSQFDDSKWESAHMPHGLEILAENASGGRNYQGIAWYRKKFDVNKSNTNNKIFLYFEAVMGKAEVWVNGHKVAEHYGGYLPFSADITEYINVGGKANIVAVKANNADSKLYPPGKNQDGLDFSYLGGIYRDTYIIETSPVYVTLPELSKTIAGAGIFVATLDINGKSAKLEVRTEVKNSGNKAISLTVKNTLENSDFIELTSVEQKVKLAAGAKEQLSKQFYAKNVHLWHPDDPYLHYVRTDIIANGEIIDQMRTRVGIRLYEMRGAQGMYINKQLYETKLIGVNRHQDYTYVGNAIPNSGQWRDVKLLREGGSKVIRVGHYPQDPAFYDACDELGMLTTTAVPGWHFFNFNEKIFEERIYNDTRNLVRRDRNVASMVMWETALNETPSQPAHVMGNMHKLAHQEYPFPGMYTVTDYHEAKKAGLDMYYHGNDTTVCSFTREYGDGGEVDNWHSQNATTRVKMEWGEKALLTQALMQAETLNELYTTHRSRLGGAKWAGIDHQRGYHPDPFYGGLLNGVRIPKYLYYVYKSQYDHNYKVNGKETGPTMFVAHELTQISPADVVVFSNCDEIRITWLGEVIGTQKPSNDPKYSDLPHPPFIFEDVFDFAIIKSKWRRKIPEVNMLIEGIINDQVVIKEFRDYPQQSFGLELSIAKEGMELTADGSDYVPVRATVVDAAGNKKVLASEYVHFEVKGAGEVIGGKANFANPVKTEFGIATALIRSTNEPGKITIIARSNGLNPDTISFESKALMQKSIFDSVYVANSRTANNDQTVLIQMEKKDMPVDVQELYKELKQLRLDIVGKEQEIMELRSRLKKDE